MILKSFFIRFSNKLTFLLNSLTNSTKKCAFLLLLLSFFVRLIVLFPISKINIYNDEKSYYRQAVGYYNIIKDVSNSKSIQKKDIDEAYNRGGWLPLNSIFMVLGFFLFSKKIIYARLVIILISSLTTLVIFLLTIKLLSFRAGLYAALIHIFYPSFIAFSHYLFSETTYIFILFLVLFVTVLLFKTSIISNKIIYSSLLGFFLGLLALTRAVATPVLMLIAIWVFFKHKNKYQKIVFPIIIIFCFSLTILPWEYFLFKKENKFVMLSTWASPIEFYKYNNRWVRIGREYVSKNDQKKALSELNRFAVMRNIPLSKAARILTFKELSSNFIPFIKRTFENFMQLWTYDKFLLRYVFLVIYPPLPTFLLLFILFLVSTSHLLIIAFSIIGFFVNKLSKETKLLILSMIFVGMSSYLISFSQTRYNLPQIALLLPMAGLGIENIKKSNISKITFFAIFICLISVYYHTYNNFCERESSPSSYYYSTLNFLRNNSPIRHKVWAREEIFTDYLQIFNTKSNTSEKLLISILNNDGYKFNIGKITKHITLRLTNKPLNIKIISINPKSPLLMQIYSLKQRLKVIIKPISKTYWQKKIEIIPNKIKLMWTGGRSRSKRYN